MKAALKLLVLLTTVSAILPGCYPYEYYGPYNYQVNNQQEVSEAIEYTNENSEFKMTPELTYSPLLSRAGQTNVQLEVGRVTEGQLAVALTNKSALMFAYGKGSFESDASGKTHINASYDDYDYNGVWQHYTTDGIYGYSRKNECSSTFFEAAYGRYKVVNKYFRYDVYAGSRYGETQNHYSVQSNETAFNNYNTPFQATYDDFRKHASVFLQSGFGLFNDNIEFSVTARMNGYLFTYRDADANHQSYVPDYSKTVFSFNPAVRFAFGGRVFRMFMQYSGALPVASKYTDWYRQTFNGGITFMFGDETRVNKVKH
ncbi:MAG TPA: hypothetical protein VFW78_01710 [Bacteroidia bacterium]|nr:hypothetical protein [Bacteroidia bacterium]